MMGEARSREADVELWKRFECRVGWDGMDTGRRFSLYMRRSNTLKLAAESQKCSELCCHKLGEIRKHVVDHRILLCIVVYNVNPPTESRYFTKGIALVPTVS